MRRNRARICSHCGFPMRGVASTSDEATTYWLCHPDVGMDCYRLVTVHGHDLGADCSRCTGGDPNDDETAAAAPF